MKKILLIVFIGLLLPAIAFAARPLNSFTDLILIFIDLIIATLPLIAGLALLAFFWGMAKFILKAGSEDGREEGKQVMKWGIVALFVAVSLFGILTFLYNEFQFGNIGIPQLPTNI
jgi:hypothetical protein